MKSPIACANVNETIDLKGFKRIVSMHSKDFFCLKFQKCLLLIPILQTGWSDCHFTE